MSRLAACRGVSRGLFPFGLPCAHKPRRLETSSKLSFARMSRHFELGIELRLVKAGFRVRVCVGWI